MAEILEKEHFSTPRAESPSCLPRGLLVGDAHRLALFSSEFQFMFYTRFFIPLISFPANDTRIQPRPKLSDFYTLVRKLVRDCTLFFSFTPFPYKIGLIRTLVSRAFKINNTWNGFRTNIQ